MIYTGVFLDDESKTRLREFVRTELGQLHEREFCHHMTVAFRPPEGVGDLPIGSVVTLRVVSIAGDDKGQAVGVEGFASNNAVPHITVSCAQGVSPVYSNELLAARRPVDGPVLRGTVGYFDGKAVCTS